MIIVKAISRNDFEQWMGNPVTQQVLKAITERLDAERRDLGRGNYIDYDNADRTQAKSAEAYGKCTAFEETLKMGVE